MRNKSLVYKPCNPYTLCGINVRFRTVSPTQGQVAHALLTRPPLGIAASFDLNVLCTPPAFILSQDQTLEHFVSSLTLRLDKIFIRALWLSLPFRVFAPRLHDAELSLYRNFRDFRTRFFACTSISCCSIVNDQFLSLHSLSRAQLYYYTTSRDACQGGFESFFDFFSSPSARGGSVLYYITCNLFCQEVFSNFFKVFFIPLRLPPFGNPHMLFVESLPIISHIRLLVKFK